MDIHRCRFVPYPPSTINVLAFSHSQLPAKRSGPDTLRLAIGRGNGDIEIWNPSNGAWIQEVVIRGGKDRSIDGLAWIQNPDEQDSNGNVIPGKLRLFSIGYTTTVTEWDLKNGRPLRQSSGNHGEIWCLAAQPPLTDTEGQQNSSSSQDLVTGCIDGAIVLHSTADDDLNLKRVLARPSSKKAKILSAVFQNRNTVVVGCSNSTICVYDTTRGTQLRTMSLGSGPSGGPKEVIVWSLKCLSNGDIVSGDSAGEIRIWDGKTYSLTQRIQGHKQDILSLATNLEGTTIFSGGMDRRTVVYKRTASKNIKARWSVVSHKRFHRHDVKAMAAFEGRGMSVVVSGGPDATPIVIPLKEFGREHQRALSYLPQLPSVQSAPSSRLIMSWWDREVHIWRLFGTAEDLVQDGNHDNERGQRNRKLVAKILMRGDASITSAALTPKGNIVAVATAAETKYFELQSKNDDRLQVMKLEYSPSLTIGARLVTFSADGRWICTVRMDNEVSLIRIVSDDTSVRFIPKIFKLHRLDRKLEKRQLLGGLEDYGRTISRVAFSSDSRILAVSDLSGYIDSWVLMGDEDLSDVEDIPDDASTVSSSNSEAGYETASGIFGQVWKKNPAASLIPQLPSGAVVLSFRPAASSAEHPRLNGSVRPPATRNNPHPIPKELPPSEDRLLVVTSSSEVFEFEVLRGGLSDWSRRNPTSRFPESFKVIRDQAMGCIWDVSSARERLWLYGTSWLWMFDLSQDFPNEQPIAQKQMAPNRKRKRDDKSGLSDMDLTKGTTGAGSKIRDNQLELGMSRKFQVTMDTTDVEKSNTEGAVADGDSDMDVDEIWVDPQGDEVNDEEDLETPMLELRQKEDTNTSAVESTVHSGSAVAAKQASWSTFKYRPVMGIVPLEAQGREIDDEAGVEVAIVERPLWEIDLPPRYYGDLEWEKRGV